MFNCVVFSTYALKYDLKGVYVDQYWNAYTHEDRTISGSNRARRVQPEHKWCRD